MMLCAARSACRHGAISSTEMLRGAGPWDTFLGSQTRVSDRDAAVAVQANACVTSVAPWYEAPRGGRMRGALKSMAWVWAAAWFFGCSTAAPTRVERRGIDAGGHDEAGGGDLGQPGCPPDYESPIPERDCPQERAQGTNEVSASLELLRDDPGPHGVIVSVTGGATYCPAPECPARPNPCPELERASERYRSENLASQRCVRELLEGLGGVVEDHVFTSLNGLEARLTWPQIDALAEHPHVIYIEPSESTGAFTP